MTMTARRDKQEVYLHKGIFFERSKPRQIEPVITVAMQQVVTLSFYCPKRDPT